MESKTSQRLPYKVKDINLAEWGRKEILLAEKEMPGLMALRKEFGEEQPLKSANCWMSSYDNTNCSPY